MADLFDLIVEPLRHDRQDFDHVAHKPSGGTFPLSDAVQPLYGWRTVQHPTTDVRTNNISKFLPYSSQPPDLGVAGLPFLGGRPPPPHPLTHTVPN